MRLFDMIMRISPWALGPNSSECGHQMHGSMITTTLASEVSMCK